MQRRNFLNLTGALTLTLTADRVWAQTNKAALGQTTTQVFPIGPGDKLTF